MSDAPERIWIDPRGGIWVRGEDAQEDHGDVPYVRADRIEALEAENARLQEALADLLSNATAPHASFETGCCMCGVEMDAGHWSHEGHAPTDSGLYYAQQSIDRASAALSDHQLARDENNGDQPPRS